MQFDYILAALVGMIATGAIASPVPEAQPEAEPEAVQARAEQGAQFIGSPLLWSGRGRFNRFQDNDVIDILKRDAEPEPEPEGLEARAEQGAQFIRSPLSWGYRGGFDRFNRFDQFNRFQDNDFIDILKRDADPEALEARAEQNKQWFGKPCGWRGCFDNDIDFFRNDFQDNDFLDIGKRDESGLQARAEQAEQVKRGEQFFYPGGGRRFNGFNNFNRFNRFDNFNRFNRFNQFNRFGGQWNPNRFW